MTHVSEQRACVTNRCKSGRAQCPTPSACVIDAETTIPARAWRLVRDLWRWLTGPRP